MAKIYTYGILLKMVHAFGQNTIAQTRYVITKTFFY